MSFIFLVTTVGEIQFSHELAVLNCFHYGPKSQDEAILVYVIFKFLDTISKAHPLGFCQRLTRKFITSITYCRQHSIAENILFCACTHGPTKNVGFKVKSTSAPFVMSRPEPKCKILNSKADFPAAF